MASEAKNWLQEQVKATAEAGHEAELMSARLGLSAKEVQQLGYVGRLAHVDLEAMATGMRHLATKGAGDLHAALFQLADRIHNTKSAGMQLALAQEYLGRSGNALLPILKKGSGAIKEYYEEAERLGVVMSGEDIEAARGYETATQRLGAALTGLRNTVILPLLKPLTEMAERSIRNVLQLRQWIKNSAELRIHLKALVITLGLAAIAWGVYYIAATAATIATLAGTSAFSALAAALWATATAWFAALWPIALVVAALGAAYLIVDDIYTFIKGGDSVIGRALHKWLGPFDTWKDGLKLAWEEIKKGFKALWADLENDPQLGAFIKAINLIALGLQKVNSIMSSAPPTVNPGEESAGTAVSRGRLSGLRAGLQGIFGTPDLPGFSNSSLSPSASAGGYEDRARGVSVQIGAINVESTHGANAEDIAGMIPQKIQEHLDRANREAAAAAGS